MKNVRNDFPILKQKINSKPLIYLDSAATSQKPIQVIEAELNFYKTSNANIHRGLNTLSRMATEQYENAHENVSKFIGAKSAREIIFTKNATESLNLLAYTMEKNLSKGDEVLLTKMEHHANIVPWQQLSKRKGVVLKYAEITPDGKLDIEDLENKISPKTKIISITAASNILGTINPVEKVGKMARSAGAKFIVDAAQAAAHMKIEVKKINADFLVFSAHKMLGPTGIGVLYGKEELLEELEPFLTGGDMISEVNLQSSSWNILPWKFEAGTPNIAGAIGFGAAIDYLQKIGMENIALHEQELLKYSLKRIGEIKSVQIYGPRAQERTGILPFNIGTVHPHDVSEILDRNAVIIRAGNHCAQPLMQQMGMEGVCRASFYLYNTKEEIDALAKGIEQTKKIFGA